MNTQYVTQLYSAHFDKLSLVIGKLVTLLLFLSQIFLTASNSWAKDYGESNRYGKLTPTHVYAISLCLQRSIDLYIKHENKPLYNKVKMMTPISVTGKKPDDVFILFNILANEIDHLAMHNNVLKVSRIKREKELAIPAEIYLMSGQLLDTFTKIINTFETGKTLGDIYKTSQTSNKTPNDVFALGDLALRKIKLLEEKND